MCISEVDCKVKLLFSIPQKWCQSVQLERQHPHPVLVWFWEGKMNVIIMLACVWLNLGGALRICFLTFVCFLFPIREDTVFYSELTYGLAVSQMFHKYLRVDK